MATSNIQKPKIIRSFTSQLNESKGYIVVGSLDELKNNLKKINTNPEYNVENYYIIWDLQNVRLGNNITSLDELLANFANVNEVIMDGWNVEKIETLNRFAYGALNLLKVSMKGWNLRSKLIPSSKGISHKDAFTLTKMENVEWFIKNHFEVFDIINEMDLKKELRFQDSISFKSQHEINEKITDNIAKICHIQSIDKEHSMKTEKELQLFKNEVMSLQDIVKNNNNTSQMFLDHIFNISVKFGINEKNIEQLRQEALKGIEEVKKQQVEISSKLIEINNRLDKLEEENKRLTTYAISGPGKFDALLN